ncbi:hypothetical protein [Vogesella indigofera]|uniref:hypothetical protein n=1 Tax=Vogesella indigofera TaxID=45465 RepID=UPI0011C497AA|nr:hypothetical protein [Vogesella indigofera]
MPDISLDRIARIAMLHGTSRLEPIHDLLRFGDTALKTASECSFTTYKLRFLSRFRLVSL